MSDGMSALAKKNVKEIKLVQDITEIVLEELRPAIWDLAQRVIKRIKDDR